MEPIGEADRVYEATSSILEDGGLTARGVLLGRRKSQLSKRVWSGCRHAGTHARTCASDTAAVPSVMA